MKTMQLFQRLMCVAVSLVMSLSWAQPAAGEAAAAPATRPADGRTVRFFILSGQSNAGGKGIGSDLPADLKKTDPDVLRFGRAAKGDLVPIGPYPRKGFGTEDTAFGVELIFAKEMKKAFPEDIICIAKQTRGGTSIIAWDKDWKTPAWEENMKMIDNVAKGPQYDALISTARDAMAALKKHPNVQRIEISGMLWVQSERDDHNPKAAAMYGDNLRKLIANVRADMATEAMPFLLADANARQHRDVIHAGMAKVVAEVPNTAMVSIDKLGRDGVHYDSDGQLELGRRFAAAYLNLIHRSSTTQSAAAPAH